MSDVTTTHILRRTLFAGGFALLGAVGALGLQATAGPGAHGPGMRGGHPGAMFHYLLEDIDLTDAQQDALRELRDDMRGERAAMRDERAADLDRLGVLVTADEIDRAAVHDELDRKAAQKLEMVHEVADRLIDFHGTLSADQRAQLGEKVGEMKARVESRHADFERYGDDDDFQGRRGRRR